MNQLHSRSARPSFRPGLEALEDRITPAVNYNESTLTLNVKATNNPAFTDRITVTDKGTDAAGAIVVTVNGVVEFRSETGRAVRSIKINPARGRDIVTYNVTGDMNNLQRSVAVKLAAGADVFKANLSRILNNSNLVIDVNGGADADNLEGTVKRELLNGSFLAMLFKGGDAKDKISISNTVNRNIDASSQMTASIDGGTGADAINFAYAGLLQGDLFLDAFGSGDNDVVAARMTLASPSTGRLIGVVSANSGDNVAQVRGGDGADNLTFIVEGTAGELTPPLGALAFAEIDGGAALDTVVLGNPANSALIIATFNIGA